MQKKIFRIVTFYLLLSAIVYGGIIACEFATGGSGGGGSGNGVLYLLDNQNTQVDIFTNATTLSGTVTPTTTLTGDPTNSNTNPSFTYMVNPTAIAIDPVRNILYVADSTQQAILAYTNANTLSGQVSAARVYPYSTSSGLKGNVVDLFYDSNHDILYAADAGQQTVFRWLNISTGPLANNSGPTGQIYMGFAMSSMTVDLSTPGNLLYLGNPSASVGPAVQMYNGLLTLTNNTTTPFAPSNTFTENPSTNATLGFVNLNGLAVNPTVVSGGIIYVSEMGYPSIEIFTDASSLQNGQNSDEELFGSNTGLVKNKLNKMLIQSNSNNLWVVAGSNLVNVWQNAQQIDPNNANQAPNTSLTISGAGQIVGLALDMTR